MNIRGCKKEKAPDFSKFQPRNQKCITIRMGVGGESLWRERLYIFIIYDFVARAKLTKYFRIT